jgi:hypothetical protein
MPDDEDEVTQRMSRFPGQPSYRGERLEDRDAEEAERDTLRSIPVFCEERPNPRPRIVPRPSSAPRNPPKPIAPLRARKA